jgi:integrase
MKKTKIAKGVYQDAYGFEVVVSKGSGAAMLQSTKRFPLGTKLSDMTGWWHREKSKLIAAKGGPAGRGTLAADVDTYLRRAHLTDRRRAERRKQLAWWIARFGTKNRAMLEGTALAEALDEQRQWSASTTNKYRTALSNLFTVLDGKGAANPFANVPRRPEPPAVRRDQSYELIDAILAHIRDRGRGAAPSRTKAFLRVEAYAPVTRAQLVRMTPADVDFAGKTITTPGRHKGQGTTAKRKPISDDAVEAFRAFDAAGCWGLVPSRSSIYRTFTAARDAAIQELKRTRPDLDLSRAATMRPYDLRHSFGTMTYALTGSLSVTGALLDHAPNQPGTTMRYAQGAVDDHLKEAGKAIAAAMAARPKYAPPAALPNTSTKHSSKQNQKTPENNRKLANPRLVKKAGATGQNGLNRRIS